MLVRRTAACDRCSSCASQAGDFKAAMNAAGEYVSDAAQSAKEAVVGKVRFIAGPAMCSHRSAPPPTLPGVLPVWRLLQPGVRNAVVWSAYAHATDSTIFSVPVLRAQPDGVSTKVADASNSAYHAQPAAGGKTWAESVRTCYV